MHNYQYLFVYCIQKFLFRLHKIRCLWTVYVDHQGFVYVANIFPSIAPKSVLLSPSQTEPDRTGPMEFSPVRLGGFQVVAGLVWLKVDEVDWVDWMGLITNPIGSTCNSSR